jgi:hypothetical protein
VDARVYQIRRSDPKRKVVTDTRACSSHSRRSVSLAIGFNCFPDSCNRRPLVVISGRYAAAAETWLGRRGYAKATLNVADLVRGARVFHWANPKATDGSICDLVLRPSGSVAWIDLLEPPQYPNEDRYSLAVKSHARGGPTSLVDHGRGIKTDSLELSGTTLSWSKEGANRRAPLD